MACFTSLEIGNVTILSISSWIGDTKEIIIVLIIS